MLNIGPQELLLILVVALLIVGPRRLPELARSLGKGLRSLRAAQDEVRRTVQEVLEPEAMGETAAELRRARDEVRDALRPDTPTPPRGPGRPLRGPTPPAAPASDAGPPLDRSDGPVEPDRPADP